LLAQPDQMVQPRHGNRMITDSHACIDVITKNGY